jgi:RNA polymerase-associated protein LEO1
LARSAIPKPSDGEMYLLKVPEFLEIDPKGFTLSSFKPPTTDHHSRKPPSATFSAYGTALTTIRWRRSPSDPAQLQSNARILRWSDGSLTLQLASDPLTQYDLPPQSLAPPQVNPSKPTPTSVRDPRNKSHRTPYSAAKDSFIYLATPHTDFGVMRFTNKLTAGLKVINTSAGANGVVDEALERLQEQLLEAQRKKEEAAEGGMLVSHEDMLEDPENAKRRAEQAEKEKARAQRKLEAQMSRDRERHHRALGRSGLSGSRGGLSVAGLEDDELGGGSGGRYAGGKPSKPKKKRMLRDDYSDEDDYAGRRTTKEDEYDMEDDFMAPSDEDVDAEADGDEDEDDIDDQIEKQERARERERSRSSPKRTAPEADDDDDGEDEEDGMASKKAATKRRRVVDDDEDEDE